MIKKILISFIFIITFNFQAKALIEVDITRGNLDPLPIAVSPLFAGEKINDKIKKELNEEDIGEKISQVVENNLKNSGLFNPLSKEAFLQKPDIAHLKNQDLRIGLLLKLKH